MPASESSGGPSTGAAAARAPARSVVARVGDVPPGERKVVSVDGREIGLFNVDGTLYALRNLCPHKGGPLCRGRIRPFVRADGFGIAFEREGEILKCPWHQWEFDIRTGRCIVDPDLRVRTYSVEVERSDIVVYA